MGSPPDRLKAPSFANLQIDENFFRVGEVTYDLADRRRQLSDECWNGDNTMFSGKLRRLPEINDVDDVFARQALGADSFEILNGARDLGVSPAT